MSQFQATRDPLINLSIQINDGQAVFSYSKDGEPCHGNVEVYKAEAIRKIFLRTAISFREKSGTAISLILCSLSFYQRFFSGQPYLFEISAS